MKQITLIFLGGGLGSVARYLLSKFLSENFVSTFPFGTFGVNILGCFLIGVFLTLPEKFINFPPNLKFFLATGFCGGFTTFSAFTYENHQLLTNHEVAYFFGYTVLSVVTGLAATYVGIIFIRNI
ncbi:MAG: fluoride efflux transporter CrcB [Verrucomicrobia bacterium]|nr:fluoride efflux transporter CrcB [Cytophagales bacterium]